MGPKDRISGTPNLSRRDSAKEMHEQTKPHKAFASGIKRFTRRDSAAELHEQIKPLKPFASGIKLSDLLENKAESPKSPATVKHFPLTPKPDRPDTDWGQARQELTDIGTAPASALDALQEAEQGGLATARYVAAAGPTTTFGADIGQAQGTHAEMAGQRFALQGTADSLVLNRGGGAATLACDDSSETKISIGQDINTNDIGVTQTVLQDTSGTASLRADLFGAEGVRGTSLSGNWTTSGGDRIGASLAAIVVGGTKLVPMSWHDDQAAAHMRGRVKVQWATQIMPILGADVGISWLHLGGSVRGSGYYSRENVYEVFATPDELGEALRQRHGLAHAVASGLRTLGLKKSPVALPSLDAVLQDREAHHLQVGESVRMVRTGNMSAGLTLSAYGVRTGVYGSYTGETELTVGRVDEHHLDVVVSPKKIFSLSGNIDALVAAEAFTTGSVATAMSRAYRADLREPEARDALKALFEKGAYPGSENTPRMTRAHDSADMTQQVRHESMPTGIRTLYMQRAQRVESTWGLGIPKPFFLRGRVAGLGVSQSSFEHHDATNDGAAALTVHTRGTKKKGDAWLAGSDTTEVAAGSRKLEVFDERGVSQERFDGLDVEMHRKLGRVVGDARAKVTGEVGKLFSVETPAVKARGDAQTYSVKVSRLFTVPDFITLAACGPASRLRASYVSGCSPEALGKLCAKLATLTEGAATESLPYAQSCAAALQDFIVSHGQHGFAALHQLAHGQASDVDVTVDSSAFDKPVKKAFKMHLEYGTARRLETIKKGVKKAAKVEKEVLRGLTQLEDEAVLKSFDADDHTAKVNALRTVQHEVKEFASTLQERLKNIQVANKGDGTPRT